MLSSLQRWHQSIFCQENKRLRSKMLWSEAFKVLHIGLTLAPELLALTQQNLKCRISLSKPGLFRQPWQHKSHSNSNMSRKHTNNQKTGVKNISWREYSCEIRTTAPAQVQKPISVTPLFPLFKSCITTFRSLSQQRWQKLSACLSTHLITGVSLNCRRKRKTWQICIHVRSGVQIICKAINWMSFHILSLCCPITPARWGS